MCIFFQQNISHCSELWLLIFSTSPTSHTQCLYFAATAIDIFRRLTLHWFLHGNSSTNWCRSVVRIDFIQFTQIVASILFIVSRIQLITHYWRNRAIMMIFICKSLACGQYPAFQEWPFINLLEIFTRYFEWCGRMHVFLHTKMSIVQHVKTNLKKKKNKINENDAKSSNINQNW